MIVTGIREIDRHLASFPTRVRNRVVKHSIRVGLYTLFAKIKDNIPVVTGSLKRALKVRNVRSKRRGTIALEVTLSGGEHESTFSPAFAEFGTKHQQDKPVMIPVFKQDGPAARDIIMRSLLAGVLREAAIQGGATVGKKMTARQEADTY